jgi:transposase
VACPRALLTARACWWATRQLRREHASVAGLARQLGTTWRTVWRSIRPPLEAMAADESRFDAVTVLGVDEHIWHHVSTKPPEQGGRGPKELTGMVDLSRDQDGRVRARLLDLVPGRSGAVYGQWLAARGDAFRAGVGIATLDPFHGYQNAIDDQLADAVAVLDAFHVVKLGTAAVDECRRRVQQDLLGHRGRKGDPLYGIRTVLRAGAEKLTDRQGPDWRARSPPTNATSRSTWPGSALSSCDPLTPTPTCAKGRRSRPRCWQRSRPAPSPRSPDSGER